MAERSIRNLLQQTLEEAVDFYDNLDARSVAATAGYQTLRARFDRELPDEGVPDEAVIRDLVRDVEGGLLGSGGPRFFGWVVGGALPAAVAADWLASAWDQNNAIYACSPAHGVIEEVCGEWLKDVLRLPKSASFGFTTGCQMAHVTALAAARHRLLGERDWDVEKRGLFGAPPIRVITGEHAHGSILRALRFLGLGTESLRRVRCTEDGPIDVDELRRKLKEIESESESRDASAIIVLQAGDIDTGAFDPFPEVCALAREHRAWVHVDGAFGLWANASPEYRHLLDGCDQASSWATDGHKWLNLPFDNGFVFVNDREAHRASMRIMESYFVAPDAGARDQMEFNPEWSRRSRSLPAYAALRSLGRRGVAEIVERCCRLAKRLVSEIGALDGAEILSEARINQGLVRFTSPDGRHDERTDAVIGAVRDGGEAWFGGTTWRGKRAMRISVCSFRTTDDDVDRTVDAVRRAIDELGGDSAHTR
jgi:glutamate/tyrosine decarboxylase-like PLP-dependent enzyme